MRAPATVNDVTRGPENATRAALRVISGCRTGHNEWKTSRRRDGRALAPRARSKAARAPVATRGMSNPTQSGGKARRTPFSQGTRTHPRVARQAKPGGVRPAAHERFCGRAIVAHPAHDARSTRAARGARRSVRRFDEVRLCQKKQTFCGIRVIVSSVFTRHRRASFAIRRGIGKPGNSHRRCEVFLGVGRSPRIKIQSRLHRRSFFGSARSTDLNTTIGETAFAIETESANREPGISRQSRSPGNSVRTRRPAQTCSIRELHRPGSIRCVRRTSRTNAPVAGATSD